MRSHSIAKRIALAAAAVVLLLAACVFIMWRSEIAAFMSIEQVRGRDDAHQDGSVYTMHVSGGFYLDDFVEQGGVSSDSELISFVTGKITKGLIPMEISESEIACSAFTAVTADGDRLFARNYDMDKTNTCIVYTDVSPGRHATVSTVDLQFLGIDPESDMTGFMEKVNCLAAP